MNGNVRINRFDNLKGIAIILIVLGHMTFLTSFKSVNIIHNFIYIIHLPIFFFVAGYFSKIGPDEPIKAFKRLFVPFVIFCIIYELFSVFIIGNHPNTKLFINPGYALWFLISLFTMKLLLPIFDKFRYPILTAFIIALLIGYVDADFLGVSRTCAFLPIFLVGFYYNDLKEKIETKYNKISSLLENNLTIIILFIITIICCIIVAYVLPFKTILLKDPYKNYSILNMLIRSIILILGGFHALLLNRLMTNNKNILTKIGKNSLSVYLLHVYFVVLIRPLMKPYFSQHEKLFIITAVIISFIIVYILSRDFVAKGVNKLTDSVFKLISYY